MSVSVEAILIGGPKDGERAWHEDSGFGVLFVNGEPETLGGPVRQGVYRPRKNLELRAGACVKYFWQGWSD